METKLLIHPLTNKQLSAYLAQPAGTLLVVGQAGAGKAAVARELASQLLSTDEHKINNHPYFIWLDKPADKSEISINDVRDIIKKMALKVASDGEVNRVIVINGAEFLSPEAQNALLKLLEEPALRSAFILTSSSPDKVLPTILSRAQIIKVLPVRLKDSLRYYSSPVKEIESAWQRDHPGRRSVVMT